MEQRSETFEAVLSRRLSRREAIRAGLVATATAAGAATVLGGVARGAAPADSGAVEFTPVQPDADDTISLPAGYAFNVVMAWGDPIVPDEDPALDLTRMTSLQQTRRFGYNADYIALLPFNYVTRNRRGLLWVNHEYTDGAMMFHGYDPANPTRDQVEVELQAHGGTVVEVARRADGSWRPVVPSHYNRRISATSPIRISGPAAGHRLLKTSSESTGTAVLGTLNNCGGGTTPWGTVLSAEENFNQYFANNSTAADPSVKASHKRYGIPDGPSERGWEKFHPRFDVAREPNEPFRFGWVVEVDPFDPSSLPVKRTALGRMKHEAADCHIAPDGRVVVYTGDDERFDYVYKYVSHGEYDARRGKANGDLLDSGVLHVARFNDDGSGEWIPIGHSHPLLKERFDSQAEVLIRTREAADLLGATKMDRPEDIQANPKNGAVYLAMTNNTNRAVEGNPGTNAANPRPQNKHGHIIELVERNGDIAATSFRWGIFMLCGPTGDPSRRIDGADPSQMSNISSPDNIEFDSRGNLWISTDGQPNTIQANDAIHAVATFGPGRGQMRQFMSSVRGAEVTGPWFTEDDRTLFVAIQHPGEGGTLAQPKSTWPGPIARAAVIAIRRPDGLRVGR